MKKTALPVILVLALVLALALAGTALAAGTPANDGGGLDFGQHHADMAQGGTLGQGMNPGMHRGFRGWQDH